MGVRKMVAALLSGLMLATGGVAVTAEPASAAYGDKGYVQAGSEIRYGPSQFYGIAYITNFDAWLLLGCWTDDGNGRRWFSLAYQSQRWVRADNVTQQPVLPHC